MQRIGFIVFPGFQVMSCAVIAAFELANREMDEPVYDVRLLSETGGYIRASIGMSVATDPFDRANRLTESTVDRNACEHTPKDGCTLIGEIRSGQSLRPRRFRFR